MTDYTNTLETNYEQILHYVATLKKTASISSFQEIKSIRTQVDFLYNVFLIKINSFLIILSFRRWLIIDFKF